MIYKAGGNDRFLGRSPVGIASHLLPAHGEASFRCAHAAMEAQCSLPSTPPPCRFCRSLASCPLTHIFFGMLLLVSPNSRCDGAPTANDDDLTSLQAVSGPTGNVTEGRWISWYYSPPPAPPSPPPSPAPRPPSNYDNLFRRSPPPPYYSYQSTGSSDTFDEESYLISKLVPLFTIGPLGFCFMIGAVQWCRKKNKCCYKKPEGSTPETE